MKSTLAFLAALSLLAWGTTAVQASATFDNDFRAVDMSVPQQLAQVDLKIDQLAWAEDADEPETDQDQDQDQDQDRPGRGERERERPSAGSREPGDRPEMDRPRRAMPAAMEQMRELFQEMRRARATGNEPEAAELMERIRQRMAELGRPDWIPGPAGRFGPPDADGPRRGGFRPPGDVLGRERGEGETTRRGPDAQPERGLREGRPRPEAPREGAPPEARRPGRRGPNAGPGPAQRGPGQGMRRPGGPPWATPMEARRPGRRGPNAGPGPAQRGPGQGMRRPGPPPWADRPEAPRPGRAQGPPAAGRYERGPGPEAPRQELRQLREEMRALREAIQQLTEQVEAARRER